jgi:membrane peptidoglycan carboxypeptidase
LQRKLPRQAIGAALIGVLVLGVVIGFALAIDREVRGGILRQRLEAMQRPDWVELRELPAYVPEIFLAVVDPGFGQTGTIRTRAGRSTTIPRELVREVHLLGSGLRGHARELVMAPVLEQRASRDQVLELYLNRVYLGEANGMPVYGLYHAAHDYLGKEPSQMTLSESATLAALLLEPRIPDPDAQPGAVGVRRNEILRSLLLEGAISQEQYQEAISEALAFQPGLRKVPMTRRLPLPADTLVIRLPPPGADQPAPEPGTD